jgi:Na+(H+)/acetate symporter ActP
VVGYFKFHEIVFSNIFGVQVFCSRVESVLKLHPFDILLGVSAFLSVWIVIGSSLISYSVQEYGVKSSTFIQSIDCIVVVVLNLIPTILIFRRKSEDYEKDINSGNSQLYLANDQGNNL